VAYKPISKSSTAVKIIKTIIESMRDGVQKDALMSVAEWIQEKDFDFPEDAKERRALADKLKNEICLSCPGAASKAKRN